MGNISHMAKAISDRLSGRERQIMDAVYRLGPATAVEIHGEIEAPPSLSTIRKLIRILEAKGYLGHSQEGKRHVYTPAVDKEQASSSALEHLVETFFGGSVAATATALFNATKDRLSPEDAAELAELIDQRTKKDERR